MHQPRTSLRLAQTKQRLYDKDLGFSYKPFLPILGTGLVTANGQQWQKQRVLIGPALRVDILVNPCMVKCAYLLGDSCNDTLIGYVLRLCPGHRISHVTLDLGHMSDHNGYCWHTIRVVDHLHHHFETGVQQLSVRSTEPDLATWPSLGVSTERWYEYKYAT